MQSIEQYSSNPLAHDIVEHFVSTEAAFAIAVLAFCKAYERMPISMPRTEMRNMDGGKRLRDKLYRSNVF